MREINKNCEVIGGSGEKKNNKQNANGYGQC